MHTFPFLGLCMINTVPTNHIPICNIGRGMAKLSLGNTLAGPARARYWLRRRVVCYTLYCLQKQRYNRKTALRYGRTPVGFPLRWCCGPRRLRKIEIGNSKTKQSQITVQTWSAHARVSTINTTVHSFHAAMRGREQPSQCYRFSTTH